jgi:hypothetical protein
MTRGNVLLINTSLYIESALSVKRKPITTKELTSAQFKRFIRPEGERVSNARQRLFAQSTRARTPLPISSLNSLAR